ncbi:MAG: DNA polymerase III subunit beta, partial [Pygmaiobacter sp.]
MKFQCEKQSLSEAIAGVSKAVTQRSNVAALEGILFTAIGTSLTLTGYDLEMGI